MTRTIEAFLLSRKPNITPCSREPKVSLNRDKHNKVAAADAAAIDDRRSLAFVVRQPPSLLNLTLDRARLRVWHWDTVPGAKCPQRTLLRSGSSLARWKEQYTAQEIFHFSLCAVVIDRREMFVWDAIERLWLILLSYNWFFLIHWKFSDNSVKYYISRIGANFAICDNFWSFEGNRKKVLLEEISLRFIWFSMVDKMADRLRCDRVFANFSSKWFDYYWLEMMIYSDIKKTVKSGTVTDTAEIPR